MRRLATALVALGWAGGAWAHGTGSHTGLVNTVVGTEPNVPGIVAEVLGEHERLTVRNYTPSPVVLFDRGGRPLVRLPPGRAETWRDPRISWTGPLPEQETLLRTWRVPGETRGRRFAIVGFLGYVPPRQDEATNGTRPWLIAAAVGSGVLLLAAVAVGARLLRRAPTA